MKFPIETPRKQVNWDPEQGTVPFKNNIKITDLRTHM